jgi:hypothetical protein
VNKLNWRVLIETVGVTAVVLSLIFVGVQLWQDRLLARSQLGAESLEAFNSIMLETLDPEFAEVFAKMVEDPNNLTTAEMVQLNGFLQSVKVLFVRECYLVQRAVFEECAGIIGAQVPRIFGNSYAKSWWRARWQSGGVLEDWVNSLVEEQDPTAQRDDFALIRQGLK